VLDSNEAPARAKVGQADTGRADGFAGPVSVRDVMRKGPRGGTLLPRDERATRIIATVGHPFRTAGHQLYKRP